jgi:hypothetical protein
MKHHDPSDLIERMFTLEAPLGPMSTPIGEWSRVRRAHDLLFDHENALGRRSVQLRPSLLIGRRGSGKTAFLHHLCFADQHQHQIVVDSAQVFLDVSTRLKELVATDGLDQLAFVESIGKVWRVVFLTAAMSLIYTRNSHDADPAIQTIKTFLEASSTLRVTSPRSILRSITALARKTHQGEFAAFADFIDEIFATEIGFDRAVEAMVAFSERRKQSTIILIDSMEQFPIHNESASFALSGLLHAIGGLRLEYLPVKICFCLPSELYDLILNCSTNPEKDLGNRLILHWRAHELVKLCAHRFDRYLGLARRIDIGDIERLPKHPSKEQVKAFWGQFLPTYVTNRQGQAEASLPYLLRHTQLLPRHLIGILNEVVRLALSKETERLQICADDLRRGLRLATESICNGVISSYEQVHPHARTMCNLVLPHLGQIFKMGEFQIKLRNHGKGVIGHYQEAFQLFKEIGAIGVVTKETDQYFVGRFEYTEPGSLAHSENDLFCVHPAFADEFRVGQGNGTSSTKAVYPLGTSLDELEDADAA